MVRTQDPLPLSGRRLRVCLGAGSVTTVLSAARLESRAHGVQSTASDERSSSSPRLLTQASRSPKVHALARRLRTFSGMLFARARSPLPLCNAASASPRSCALVSTRVLRTPERTSRGRRPASFPSSSRSALRHRRLRAHRRQHLATRWGQVLVRATAARRGGGGTEVLAHRTAQIVDHSVLSLTLAPRPQPTGRCRSRRTGAQRRRGGRGGVHQAPRR